MERGSTDKGAWRILAVLFLANLLNFFDRAIPAIVLEPVRMEWSLSDLQLSLVFSAFTLTLAFASFPLGLLADTKSRKSIIGYGLFIWSAFTGLTSVAWNFSSFLFVRIGVGIGEASYHPAATSLIGDLYPAHKRSRAMGIFMLGLPMGLLLAYATIGSIIEFFNSWRAPFIVAGLLGLVIAPLLFLIREPVRGAAESSAISVPERTAWSILSVLGRRSMIWLIVAGIAGNFAAYAVNGFMVPLLQRYHGLSLQTAALSAGAVIGLTGVAGLVVWGWLADRLYERSPSLRLAFGSGCLAVAALATWLALRLGAEKVSLFILLFALGWLMQYAFYVCVFPAIHDVVEPDRRGAAVAIYSSIVNLIGGCFGPIAVGRMSDWHTALMLAVGPAERIDSFRAIGLHKAMGIIPISLLIAAMAIILAMRSFARDKEGLVLQQATR